MGNVIQKFFNYCQTYDKYTDNTLRAYKMVYRQIQEITGKDILDISNEDIEYFIQRLREINNGISINTINLKINALSTLFEFLLSRDYIDKNPTEHIELATPEQREIIILTKDEIDDIINACTKIRNKAIIGFMFATAVRISELSNINKEDIYPLEDSEGFGVHIVQGKGRKDRQVFISGIYLDYLLQYLDTREDNNSALFISEQNNRLHPNSIRYLLKSRAKKAGIDKKVTPHTIRRSGISYLLSVGVDIYTVSQVAGHSSVETTDRFYSKISNKEKAKRVMGFF